VYAYSTWLRVRNLQKDSYGVDGNEVEIEQLGGGGNTDSNYFTHHREVF